MRCNFTLYVVSPQLPAGYNVLYAGAFKDAAALPPGIGHVGSTAPWEIYAAFESRRNAHLLGEADAMIARMLADVGKGLVPVIWCGQNE